MLFSSWLNAAVSSLRGARKRFVARSRQRAMGGASRHSRSACWFAGANSSGPAGRFAAFVELLEERALLSAWVSQGPGIVFGGQSEGITNTPVNGALHAVAADPSDANILYVGSPNGGIWKTTNATAASPAWTPLTDAQSSLSIGAIEFDPTDLTHQTLVAGFARNSSLANIGGSRIGLLRTTNGGLSWTVLDGGGTLVGANISGVAVRGSTLVVSVNVADDFNFGNTGIFRSTNGGTSFTHISVGDGSGATGLPEGVAFDLVGDPNNPAVLYTAIVDANYFGGGGFNGIYKSTNTGATWSKISNSTMEALLVNDVTNNVEMATSHAGGTDNVFVGIIQTGQLAGLFRSGNGGASFTQLDTPVTNPNGTPIGINPRRHGDGTPGSQGETHFSIVADPSNANVVYVGGDRQPDRIEEGFGSGQFPNSIGANNYSGRLFRVNAGFAPGSQAVPLTHNFTTNHTAPHADSRDMVFDANGDIIEVDDGGVYRQTAPTTVTGDWVSVIGSLGVGEQHDVAYDSLSNIIMAGFQDNGSAIQQTTGGSTWRSVGSGDGGDVAVDDVTLAGGNSIRYSSSQNLGGFQREQYNSSNVLQSTDFPALTVVSGAAFAPQFITPVVLNAVTPTRILFVGSNSAYESWNQGNTITEIADGGVNVGGGLQNAVAYGHPANANVIYLGAGASVMVRTTALGNLAATAAAVPGGGDAVRDVVLDTTTASANTAFVVDQNQVFETTNGGTSWVNLTGNLAALGAVDFRSLAFIPGVTGNAIVVGTGSGVYFATSANYSVWTKLGISTSLPNVPVFDLDYDAADKVLVAGTLGRGAFTMPNVVAETGLDTPATVGITVSPISGHTTEAGGTATFTVVLNTQPTADVMIGLSSNDMTEGTLALTSLTFTTANWATPQTVTVTGVNDDFIDGNVIYSIVTAVATGGDYAGINAADVSVTNDDNDNLGLVISDVTVSEAAGIATFTVSLPSANPLPVSVKFATANDTALAGSDYNALALATLNFAPGVTSKTISVTIRNDALNELPESFFVNLSSPTNATIADPQGVGTINDDDAKPSLRINDVTILERNPGAVVNALFTVSLSAPSSLPITVDYATADDIAKQPGDYTAAGGTLTFAPGELRKVVSVSINSDAIDEFDETFFVNLWNQNSNATIFDGQGIGTITDDDAAPRISINSATVSENSSPAAFMVSLSAASEKPITVAFATANGTAIQPGDYTSAGGTLTFAPRDTTKPIHVTVINDALVEGNETFFVNLSSPSNATLSVSKGTGNIVDGSAPTLSITDVTANEGQNAVFMVSLSVASAFPVTVNYATAPDVPLSATTADYQPVSNSLTFLPGQMSKTISVPLLSDAVSPESDERFLVNLSAPTNATLLDGQGIGTIHNVAPLTAVMPTISIGDVSMSENAGTALFAVTLSQATSLVVSVNFATANNTALSGSDYNTLGLTTLTFAAGVTSKTVSVTIRNDLLNESPESFFVNLSSPTNATIVDPQGVGTITDDDAKPSLRINDVTILERNPGAVVNVLFTVSLSAASSLPITVDYAAADGTAKSSDYTLAGGTLTFAPGDLRKTVSVLINSDAIDEFDETFFVNLLNQNSNATILDSQGIGTITDDDDPPKISMSDVTVHEADGFAFFTVSLSAASEKTITVAYATANNSATAGLDYTSTSGVLTFTPGNPITQMISVPITSGDAAEAIEQFFMSLTSPMNASILDGQGVGTILDGAGV